MISIPSPRLLALATALPRFQLGQEEVKAWARRLFPPESLEALAPIYAHAGIETRFSCVPLEWHAQPHGWAERSALYLEHALELLERAALDCLEQAGLTPGQVDAVVAVSSSGIATPSLDARLMERLGMRRDVRRLPIFGLGCAGGVIGLARAADLAVARPGQNVLCVVVELCGLTFRAGDHSRSNIVATALFGDGAAAALLRCESATGTTFAGSGEHTWSDSLDVMGWRIEEDGLGVLFSRDIPALVRTDLRGPTDAFLKSQGLALADIDHVICHPGGAKVLTAFEEALDLDGDCLEHARMVLRECGNMSAATVLFVLKRALAAGQRGRLLMLALGPGFSCAFQLVEA